ncbi:MAG: host attachment protein [Chthoniobacterales bacterium]
MRLISGRNFGSAFSAADTITLRERNREKINFVMTPATLVVVADRGSVKAYKVNETPNRGSSLELVRAFVLTDAHGRYQDKLTDQAGRFPVGDGGGQAGSGRHQNAIAERQGLETENDRRIFKELAENITNVIMEQAPEGWSFAAPSQIYSTMTDLLSPEIRDRIVEHVRADLVNIPVAELAERFRSLQPV